MRSEEEMYALIVNTAKQDENIRAVYMNGSRANPNVPRDIFQDYDIVYVVKETKPYYENEEWIRCFGEILYKQMPEKMDKLRGRTYNFDENFGWLMQFKDGNRMDLHVESIPYMKAHMLEDKLCKVLLDKDGLLTQVPPTSEVDYFVKKPTKNDYLCDCNNFWWCMNNVAKGLWREEVPYVQDMLSSWIRPHLVHMLSWKIGYEINYSCSIGKSGKYMYKYLEPSVWSQFLATYADGKVTHIWRAVEIMCDLFEETAKEVASYMAFTYNAQEGIASKQHLLHVKQLPKEAKAIY